MYGRWEGFVLLSCLRKDSLNRFTLPSSRVGCKGTQNSHVLRTDWKKDRELKSLEKHSIREEFCPHRGTSGHSWSQALAACLFPPSGAMFYLSPGLVMN